MITKAERTELRSIVRNQFKVLRAEIEQREMELRAEIEAEVQAKFADADTAWAAVRDRVGEVLGSAEREVTDLLIAAGSTEYTIQQPYRLPRYDLMPKRNKDDRQDIYRQAVADLTAKVKGARVHLDRQEADLLRTLSVGAIESDEARRFLEGIPTVGELVPATSLPQLDGPSAERREGEK